MNEVRVRRKGEAVKAFSVVCPGELVPGFGGVVVWLVKAADELPVVNLLLVADEKKKEGEDDGQK